MQGNLLAAGWTVIAGSGCAVYDRLATGAEVGSLIRSARSSTSGVTWTARQLVS